MADGIDERPIDVHHDQIADWLVDRGKAPADWFQRATPLRAQAREMLAELPADVARPPASTLNYFACRSVRDALEASLEARGEAGKNLFGQYSNLTLRAWDALVRKYEENNVYLVEAAKELTDAVTFALPSLRRELARAEKQASDLTRKIGDVQRHVGEETRSLEEDLLFLGLGAGYLPSLLADPTARALARPTTTRLRAVARKLLPTVEAAERLLRQPAMVAALAFQTAFVRHVHTRASSASASASASSSPESVPGNACIAAVAAGAPLLPPRVSEWIHSAVRSLGSDAAASSVAASSPSSPAVSDDWSGLIRVEEAESSSLTSEEADAAALESLAAADASLQEVEDDLEELAAFLRQRRAEEQDTRLTLFLDPLGDAPDVIRRHGVADSAAQLTAVEEVVRLLREPKILQVRMIARGGRSLERVWERIESRVALVRDAETRLASLRTRLDEAARSVAKLAPELRAATEEARENKKRLESNVTRLVKRRVVLVGVTFAGGA